MFRTTIQRARSCCCLLLAAAHRRHKTSPPISPTAPSDWTTRSWAMRSNRPLRSMSLYSLPNWWGKRIHLSETPVEGNAQVKVFSTTGELIYKQSFSTLFQEWLSYPEAQTVNRSFEQVLLVPYPKDSVRIQMELYNNRREVMTMPVTHHPPQRHPHPSHRRNRCAALPHHSAAQRFTPLCEHCIRGRGIPGARDENLSCRC